LLRDRLQLWGTRSVSWVDDDASRRRDSLQKRANLLHAGQRAVLQVLRYITYYFWVDFEDHVPRRLKRLQHLARHSQLVGEACPISLEIVLTENLHGRCLPVCGFAHWLAFFIIASVRECVVSKGGPSRCRTSVS
jgi:hypothetical protein